MRIVQLLPELSEGGVERGVVESSREYVKLGHESCVISNGGKLVNQIANDGGKHITLDVCSKNIFSIFTRVRTLKKILIAIKPDILHVRSRVPAWLVFFANRSLKIKVVSTVHGFNSVSFYSKIMTQADGVICVSNSIKQYIQSNYNTKNNIITVIPRGIDTNVFNVNNLNNNFITDFKQRFELNDKFVVSIVGRVTQLKDYETFINAICEVKKVMPNVTALIVGGVREDKKEYFELLKKMIKDLGLEKDIIFTLSQDKIAEIYKLSDVIVSSSKKPESFGRAVAEAIAMNTPVVATNHGGVKDIVIDGINGYFFDVGDAHTLCKNIIETKNLNFDGLKYISETFSLENMINSTLSVYKNLEQK